jgi:hydrogenase maturation protease
MNNPRLLVAGVGNIFLGDDAFGVEVVQVLARQAHPEGVMVRDFGIRGFDLACALVGDYDGVILVDATQRGQPPGTLYVIEPAIPAPEEVPAAALEMNFHTLHPERVLQLARMLGQPCPWVRIVGCEPAVLGSEEEPEQELSEPVQRAIPEAVRLVESLLEDFRTSWGRSPPR